MGELGGLEVLDKATILDRLGGDEEILQAVAQLFLQEADNYCRQLKDALAKGEAATLQRAAHTIKGLLATFVDDEGVQLAVAVEARSKAGDADAVAAGAAALEARVRQLAGLLRRTYPDL